MFERTLKAEWLFVDFTERSHFSKLVWLLSNQKLCFVCLEINNWAPHFSLLCPKFFFFSMTQKRTPQNMQRNYKKKFVVQGWCSCLWELVEMPTPFPSSVICNVGGWTFCITNYSGNTRLEAVVVQTPTLTRDDRRCVDPACLTRQNTGPKSTSKQLIATAVQEPV